MSFADKVVWVTGASSGIGEALARELLSAGAWVVLSGRNLDALARVAAIAPDRALVLPFESTDFDELPRIVETAWQWQSRIDLLINNAGVSQRSLTLDTSFDVYRRLIEVDYLAPVALTQQLVPLMVQRRCGHIAVVSSVAGNVEAAMRTIIDGLSQGLREIPVAEGFELAALRLRTHEPERLYDMLSQEGARLAAARAQQGPDTSLDPADVRSVQA